MTKPVPALDDGGRLLPLRQLEMEAEARVRREIEQLEAEYPREFGRERAETLRETGQEPWAGFLDLSQL